MANAFEHLVREAHAKPSELDTDQGPEFKGPFEEYLSEEKIAHTTADLRIFNARGTFDAAIRSFKQQLSRIQVAEKTRETGPRWFRGPSRPTMTLLTMAS